MRFLLTLASLLSTSAACSTSTQVDETMPRATACAEQADAWCTRGGQPFPGCRTWYTSQECERGGPDGTVSVALEDACLQAIADNPTPDVEPAECRLTWN